MPNRLSQVRRPQAQAGLKDDRKSLRKISGSITNDVRVSSNLEKQVKVPAYVLQAAEAAVKARGRARCRKGNTSESDDTLVGTNTRKKMPSKIACSSYPNAASFKESLAAFKPDISSDFTVFDEPQTSLDYNVRSSIGIRIWETQSVIDLLRPTSDSSSTMEIAESSLGRRLAVAWKSASALTRRLFTAGTSAGASASTINSDTSGSGTQAANLPSEFDMIIPPLEVRNVWELPDCSRVN